MSAFGKVLLALSLYLIQHGSVVRQSSKWLQKSVRRSHLQCLKISGDGCPGPPWNLGGRHGVSSRSTLLYPVSSTYCNLWKEKCFIPSFLPWFIMKVLPWAEQPDLRHVKGAPIPLRWPVGPHGCRHLRRRGHQRSHGKGKVIHDSMIHELHFFHCERKWAKFFIALPIGRASVGGGEHELQLLDCGQGRHHWDSPRHRCHRRRHGRCWYCWSFHGKLPETV